jgi:hypothetical protein
MAFFYIVNTGLHNLPLNFIKPINRNICVSVVTLTVDPFDEQQNFVRMVILTSHWVAMLIFFKTTFTRIALFKV